MTYSTDNSLNSLETDANKWNGIAASVDESTSTVPMITLLGEALDLAGKVVSYWEPEDGKKPRPGLKNSVNDDGFPATAAADLHELAAAVAQVHNEYRAVTADTLSAPVERAEFLIADMRECLEFVFDDGKHPNEAASLNRLNETNVVTSQDGMAMALEGYAIFGNKHRDALANLPEFDLAMLDEAVAVADKLRKHSAIKLSGEAALLLSTKLGLRNRLITVLAARMAEARRVMRFVFRNHPDIALQAGSAYQRTRRAAYRAAQEAEEQAATGAAAVSPVAAPTASPVAVVATTAAATTEGARGNPFIA